LTIESVTSRLNRLGGHGHPARRHRHGLPEAEAHDRQLFPVILTQFTKGTAARRHSRAVCFSDAFLHEKPPALFGSEIELPPCGMIGADVRPDWSPHVNKRHI